MRDEIALIFLQFILEKSNGIGGWEYSAKQKGVSVGQHIGQHCYEFADGFINEKNKNADNSDKRPHPRRAGSHAGRRTHQGKAP